MYSAQECKGVACTGHRNAREWHVQGTGMQGRGMYSAQKCKGVACTGHRNAWAFHGQCTEMRGRGMYRQYSALKCKGVACMLHENTQITFHLSINIPKILFSNNAM